MLHRRQVLPVHGDPCERPRQDPAAVLVPESRRAQDQLVTMLETTAKCMPKGLKRDREVAGYLEVVSRRYAPFCDEEPLWVEDVVIGTGEEALSV